MQYELQKLERMSLDDVREIARNMGLNPRRSQSIREISYAILDAQADNRAAVVQAKEEARAAAGQTGKRERTRGVKRAAAKVDTSNHRSEKVKISVGTEKEQLAQMQANVEANNHRPSRTVQQVGGLFSEEPKAEVVEVKAKSEEVKAKSEEVKTEAPEAPKPKKRGRPRKNEVRSETASAVGSEKIEAPKEEVKEEQKAESQKPKAGRRKKAAAPKEEPAAKIEEPVAEEPVQEAEPEVVLPDLGENVIGMGTLECAPDGYGFLRSAD